MLDPTHWQTVARIRACLSLDTDRENQDGERMAGSARHSAAEEGNHGARPQLPIGFGTATRYHMSEPHSQQQMVPARSPRDPPMPPAGERHGRRNP
jgi:hypothetical protein